jgi:diaminopimelate decarboxylase
VVSGGELEIALRSGMSPARIGFAGNNKDVAEVGAAATAGIGYLVVDSLHELGLAETLPAGRPLRALLRLSPGIKPDTHDFISTGQLDSKFGFSIETGAALDALRQSLGTSPLEVRGVHIHIGSQIFDLRSYAAALDMVAGFLATARAELGFVAAVLSIGGGLGIAYTERDAPPTVREFMTRLAHSVRAAWESRALTLPALIVEPGRSVVGPAGLAVYSVGARKEIPGVRTYVAVDGGMADNLRPKLYGAVYQPLAVIEPAGAGSEVVALAGRYCESTDILVEAARLPRLQPGDLVALPAAGAYTLSMSSNYNAALRPAVLFVAGGRARLVRRRETVDDLLACELPQDG